MTSEALGVMESDHKRRAAHRLMQGAREAAKTALGESLCRARRRRVGPLAWPNAL